MGCVLSILLLSQAWGDVIELTSGETIEGDIVEETNTRITVEFNAGKMYFNRSEIKSVRPSVSFGDDVDTSPVVAPQRTVRQKESARKTAAITYKKEDVNLDAELDYFLDFFGSKKAFLAAFEEYKKTVAHNPDDVETRYKLGLSYFYLKDYEQAISELDMVCMHDPMHFEANRFLGFAHYRAGEINDAITQFKKCLTIRPFDGKIRRLLAESYYQLGDIDNAKTEYETALKYNPTDRLIVLKLEKIYTQIGNKAKAKELRTRAQSLASGSSAE